MSQSDNHCHEESPIFDRKELYLRLGEDDDIFYDILWGFLDTLNPYVLKQIDAIKQDLDAESMEQAAKSAHSAKGMFANISAIRAFQTAVEIEGSIKQNDAETAYALISRLHRDFNDLVSEIRRVVGNMPRPETDVFS